MAPIALNSVAPCRRAESRKVLAEKVQHDHVLGLKTRGQADVAARRDTDNLSDELIRSQLLHIMKRVRHSLAHRGSPGKS